MNDEQVKRIVEIVKANPGISIVDLDEELGGMLLGVGRVAGVTTEEMFDAQLVGMDKKLKKTNGGYFVN